MLRNKVLVGTGVGIAAAAGLAFAYLYADAQDLVPGWITAAPVEVPQAPFITASPVAPTPTPFPVEGLDTDAPRPDAARLQALAETLRADPRTGESTNVSVIDWLDGTEYVKLDARDPQVPASTTKLLTAVAAVSVLGPDFQLPTTVTWDAGRSVLTLVAGGDEMLAAGYGHGGQVETGEDPVNGWAGIEELADQVVAAVGDDATVSLAVDDALFEGPAWPDVWPQYALDNGYAAPVTGLAVDVGRLTDDHYAQRAGDPSLAAGETLAAALEARGVVVEGEVTRASSPADAQAVGEVLSAPLSEISRLLLAESDNTVAEAVARVLALETGKAGTREAGARAVQDAVAALGANVTGLKLLDGAGYAEDNQIAPITLTTALAKARTTPELVGLIDWLPLAGLEGTVESRYAETETAGFWRAKTGSLTGVTAIAGVLTTADGRELAVAILADGMPYGQANPMAAFDEFLGALAQCGCDG